MEYKMKVKTLFTAMIIFLAVFFANSLYAQDTTRTKKSSMTQEKRQNRLNQNQRFVDEDGDGYNDNAPDHDGDGIPNGLDPDWQKLKAGKGKKKSNRYVDLDGDGINDYQQPGSETGEKEGDHLNSQKKGSSLNQKSKQESGQQKKRQHGKD